MKLVVDASVLVATLVGGGSDGDLAAAVLADHELIAPHLMPIEVANILQPRSGVERATSARSAGGVDGGTRAVSGPWCRRARRQRTRRRRTNARSAGTVPDHERVACVSMPDAERLSSFEENWQASQGQTRTSRSGRWPPLGAVEDA